ncbi:hypothetical protein M413DRAFT_79042 [Hebeloma cylindrosporum]|uniref:Uncharacterized protein n=1 Tax=Hebeloma cylindrosporum TaxID=76867 RepID=A0A0C2Y3Z5_HEBCY|nr:hypothetical protein M413DRAFT_79042 [Hebeloma cylindrosporum h7]
MYPTTQFLAEEILSSLYSANAWHYEYLTRRLNSSAGTRWYEDLAATVLARLENEIKAGAPMGERMRYAYDTASRLIEAMWQFAKDHPLFVALVALGILVILAPWAVRALGFGELGPVKGSFAAWWQSTYAGYVLAGSLFSFLQRLGMVLVWVL